MAQRNPPVRVRAHQQVDKGALRGQFLESLPLYRVVDYWEMIRIKLRRSVEGGNFATPEERSAGASFGANRDEVVRFGIGWSEPSWVWHGKKKVPYPGRLGRPLFLLEVDAQGRAFGHLGAVLALEPRYTGPGEYILPSEVCTTGLGCSLRVTSAEVNRAYAIEPDYDTDDPYGYVLRDLGPLDPALDQLPGAGLRIDVENWEYAEQEALRIRCRFQELREEYWNNTSLRRALKHEQIVESIPYVEAGLQPNGGYGWLLLSVLRAELGRLKPPLRLPEPFKYSRWTPPLSPWKEV